MNERVDDHGVLFRMWNRNDIEKNEDDFERNAFDLIADEE